ncbi:MAG: GGDEF domain-containing protein [Lachnospiraceae bacterium]|nr:GGDEF domain-containing protein [Lachnospiraceae bacterium]
MKRFIRKVYDYLCQEYNAIILVDLVNDRIDGYVNDDDGSSRRITGEYTVQMERIAGCMAPEYAEQWRRLGIIAHIQGLLQSEDRIEIEYRMLGTEVEWQKAVFQVMEREAGVATHMILAHIPMDSIQIEKEELTRQLQEQKEQLEESLNREAQYRKAIMEGAAAVYEINLTKDILLRASGFYQDKEYQMTRKVGLEIPCLYSDYVKRMADFMPGEKEAQAYTAASSRDSLLKRFYQKDRYTDDVYQTKDVAGKRQYLKKTYILTENDITGDIHALIIAKNVTLQQQREMLQREIIDGVSTEFTSIYVVDWRTDHIRLFKSNNTYPSLMGLVDGVESTPDVLSRYAVFAVHPEDRETFMQEMDSARLREELEKHNVVDINYRRIVDGKTDYAQIHCVRVNNNGGEPNIVMAFRSIDEIVRKERAHLEEKEFLTRKSRIDGLTGLLNKETFTRDTTDYLETSSAKNAAFIFLDVDHFKSINDTFGHSTGDRLIKDVADKIQVVFANCDLVGRFGGDEFCVLVKNIPKATLKEKLEWALQKLQCRYQTAEGEICVTASIGCAYCITEHAEYQAMLDLADEALYDAKEGGRNQYVMKIYR